jgi:hypothetical protein
VHQQIIATLAPAGEPGKRDWDAAGPYARQHLAAHAAACGDLDILVSDPGFLLPADPAAILIERANLRTPDGKRALVAFELSMDAQRLSEQRWLGSLPMALPQVVPAS